MRMLGKLFSNLMRQSEHIAVAMTARGFVGPKGHKLITGSRQEVEVVPNAVAVLTLGCLIFGSFQR